MAGIQNLLDTIESVGELVVDVTELVKRGIGIGSLGKLFEVLGDAKELVENATASLPELTDVDADEAGLLASAAYVQIQRIVTAVVG